MTAVVDEQADGPVEHGDDDADDLSTQLDDVQQRLNEHPGYREYLACEELARTVNAVFVPNLNELVALLLQPTVDEALAVELFQNVRRPVVRERYEAAVTQRLHNYVAGAATLVDHARRLMKGRTGSVAEGFAKRKAEVATTPEVAFIKDLRNFVLHQAHPFLGHTVTIKGTTGPAVGELQLSVTNLLAWNGWKAPARTFIKDQDEAFALRPVVLRHGQLMVALHNGLHNELAEANAAALNEANQLVVERNAILCGGDMMMARNLTAAFTKLRESPTPIRSEDLPDILQAAADSDDEPD
jgi:hypothetical protein